MLEQLPAWNGVDLETFELNGKPLVRHRAHLECTKNGPLSCAFRDEGDLTNCYITYELDPHTKAYQEAVTQSLAWIYALTTFDEWLPDTIPAKGQPLLYRCGNLTISLPVSDVLYDTWQARHILSNTPYDLPSNTHKPYGKAYIVLRAQLERIRKRHLGDKYPDQIDWKKLTQQQQNVAAIINAANIQWILAISPLYDLPLVVFPQHAIPHRSGKHTTLKPSQE